MEFQKSSIPEVIICTPKVYEDDRGFLSESYRKDKLNNFIEKRNYNFNYLQKRFKDLEEFFILPRKTF